eukprot:scaffold80208_cov71-Phaeocystis_antarctica.AAC.2
MHAGRGLPRRSLHSPSIISRRCESPTKVTARRRGSGTELQAAPATGRHVGLLPLAPPVRHAPPRLSPTVHMRRCAAGRSGFCSPLGDEARARVDPSALRFKRGGLLRFLAGSRPCVGTAQSAPTVCVSTQIQPDAHAGGFAEAVS